MNMRVCILIGATLSLVAGGALAAPMASPTPQHSPAVRAKAVTPVPLPKPADQAMATAAFVPVDMSPAVIDSSDHAAMPKPVQVYWFLGGR